MTLDEAERAAAQVRAETGLSSTLGSDGDDAYWVDIEVPQGDESKAIVTLHEEDDWAWLAPTHVLPWLRRT